MLKEKLGKKTNSFPLFPLFVYLLSTLRLVTNSLTNFGRKLSPFVVGGMKRALEDKPSNLCRNFICC